MARDSVTIVANGPKVNIENVLICRSCAGGVYRISATFEKQATDEYNHHQHITSSKSVLGGLMLWEHVR
jgi:hypothetical protein